MRNANPFPGRERDALQDIPAIGRSKITALLYHPFHQGSLGLYPAEATSMVKSHTNRSAGGPYSSGFSRGGDPSFPV